VLPEVPPVLDQEAKLEAKLPAERTALHEVSRKALPRVVCLPTAARGARRPPGSEGSRRKGQPNPGLRFNEAADKWLAGQVADLRPATQTLYEAAVRVHLRPRWGRRRLDAISVDDVARLVRDLRAEGKSEWTIKGVLKAASRIFPRRAYLRCGGSGPPTPEFLPRSRRAIRVPRSQ
jgi:hypothetical protein